MFIIMNVREENFSEKRYFHKEKDWWRRTIIDDSLSYLFFMLVFQINSFSMMKEKLGVKERYVYLSRPGRIQQFEEK